MKVRGWIQHVAKVAAALVVYSGLAHAQGGATVSGQVTNQAGAPIPGVNVFLQGLNIGTQTGDDGKYSFTVAASRVSGQSATLVARVIGYAAKTAKITLAADAKITQDFILASNPLRLGEVVVTGAGTSTTRERIASSISSVDSGAIIRAATPQNVVSALSGKAPGVEVRTQSGDPGASASIKIRGSSSLTGTGQPLFVVDGQPIDNTTFATSPDGVGQASLSGTVTANRAADINPNDIESIEILKGSAAAAIYGARAAEGVVLITTKRGRSGPTRYTFSSTETFDNVNTNLDMQHIYGQGSGGNPPAAGCGVTSASCTSSSWGPLLAAGTPTYDHQSDIFRTGLTADNALQISGGNDRTTFFVSGGLTNQNGVVIGPNNKYNRATVRAKGSQQVTPTLNLGANLSYIDTRGRYVQKGSTTSGLLLGSLRTPPNFNNAVYLTPEGLQRSYRFPNPGVGTDTLARGYDNPFWLANVPIARSELGRSISNVNGDWSPLSWLNIKYTLGADYYNDWRLQSEPFSASDDPVGRVIRNDINFLEIDHNLVATATHAIGDNANNTLTVGQNLNSRRDRETYVLGEHLNAPAPFALQNTLQYTPQESQYLAHVRAYFVQDELDLYNQLYLSVGLRDDGFSTFGSAKRTALYPKASLAWNFTNAMGNTDQKGLLSYGKLRFAYGETGKEPPIYASISALTNTQTFQSGFGDEINTNQSGRGGLTEYFILGNNDLKPERSRETEFGGDFGFFDQRADFSITAYNKKSSDVILPLTINTAATGYIQAYKNAASISNKGVEASFNMRPYTSKDVAWDFGVQFTRNRGKVLSLAGTESVNLNNNSEGFQGAEGTATVGLQPGVIRGSDFIRCGRGLQVDLGNGPEDVDALCAATTGGYKKGALFLGPDGLPVIDPTDRVIADPNPKHILSYTSSLKLWNKLTISTLFDARHGGEVWDGTRGALYRFGTSQFTTIRNQTDGQFGKNFLTNVYPNVAGPGAGVVAFQSYADWQTWFQGDGGQNGPQFQFIEDGSFVKWRELSLTYSVDAPFIRRAGFSNADLRIAGRNLHTWTKYKGLDPEANLQGAESLTQGIDFFNNPQTRSLVLSISLNR